MALSWLACDFATWEDLTPGIVIELGRNRACDYPTVWSQDLNLEVLVAWLAVSGFRRQAVPITHIREEKSKGGGLTVPSRALRAACSWCHQGAEGHITRSFLSLAAHPARHPPIPLRAVEIPVHCL